MKQLGPLRRRLRLMIGRGILKLIDDGTGIQTVQISLLADEVRAAERFQQYGYTSRPLAGAEVITASVGGNRDHSIVLVIDDRRYRLRNLAEGEVALYTDEGDKIHFKRGNEILIDAQATVTINGATAVNVNAGDATVTCTGKAVISAAGTVELDGAGGGAVKGVVQGDCICAFTGAPHPQISATVKGTL